MKWFQRTGYVAAGLMLSVAVASAAAAPDQAARRLVVRGWAPVLTLAGAPPADAAMSLIRRGLHINRLALNALVLGPELEALAGEVLGSLNDFDLEQLYELLPEARQGWRSLAIAGRPVGGEYHVRRVPLAEVDSPLNALGQMQALLSLYPMADPRGTRYKVLMRYQANVGPVSWRSVLDAVHQAALNISRLAEVRPPAEAVAGIKAMRGDLSAVEQRILAQLWTAFPATFGWYAQFGAITNYVVESDSGSNLKHFRVTFQLQRDALRRLYPAVASYLEELGDFLTAEVVVQGDHGRWLTATLDTQSLRTTVEFWLADGELVPTRGGRPIMEQVAPGFPDSNNWRTSLDLTLSAFGVEVHIDNLITRWRYDRVPHGAHFSGLTSSVPDIAVDGRLLGVLPSSWVQGLSPVTVKGTVIDFMQVLADSNNGEGARLIVNFDDGGNQGSTVMVAADWAALDNFFVRLGMGMISDRVIPDEAQAEGLRRLATDALTRFAADLERRADIRAD